MSSNMIRLFLAYWANETWVRESVAGMVTSDDAMSTMLQMVATTLKPRCSTSGLATTGSKAGQHHKLLQKMIQRLQGSSRLTSNLTGRKLSRRQLHLFLFSYRRQCASGPEHLPQDLRDDLPEELQRWS